MCVQDQGTTSLQCMAWMWRTCHGGRRRCWTLHCRYWTASVRWGLSSLKWQLPVGCFHLVLWNLSLLLQFLSLLFIILYLFIAYFVVLHFLPFILLPLVCSSPCLLLFIPPFEHMPFFLGFALFGLFFCPIFINFSSFYFSFLRFPNSFLSFSCQRAMACCRHTARRVVWTPEFE